MLIVIMFYLQIRILNLNYHFQHTNKMIVMFSYNDYTSLFS